VAFARGTRDRATGYGLSGSAVSNASSLYASVRALFDVSSGSNGIRSIAYLYNGAVGYDEPTGSGMPDSTTASKRTRSKQRSGPT